MSSTLHEDIYIYIYDKMLLISKNGKKLQTKVLAKIKAHTTEFGRKP